MPARSRAFPLLFFALALACASKSDVPADDGCTTLCGGDDAGGSSSGGDEGGGDAGTHATSPTTTTTTATVTGDPTGADASTGGGSTGDDTAGSTGEPADDIYGPCTQDAECDGGLCFHGFCSAQCWSQTDGETPCPAAPEGSGIEVVCGRIPVIGVSHACETSLDRPQFCIPTCTPDSMCPGGGTCVTDLCAEEPFCGRSPYELDDATCSDGIDNDDDGYVDCDDFDCSMGADVTICGGENDDAACSNGVDDDDDGYVDCDDFDCSMNPDVTVCG